MAGIARGRKIERHMIGIRRALELRHMARRAIWQNAVLTPDKGFMTSLAFNSGVSANQGEKILMVADLLPGSEPALHDMALGAVRTKFTQVNVSVTV
jgi:hypothetical protein